MCTVPRSRWHNYHTTPQSRRKFHQHRDLSLHRASTTSFKASLSVCLSEPHVHFFTPVSPSLSTVTMAPASALSSPHKPRRKPKKTIHFDASVKPEAEALVRSPTFPLEAILWPARSSLSQWEVLPLVLMAAGLFRWAAGLWGYSGSYSLLCSTRL